MKFNDLVLELQKLDGQVTYLENPGWFNPELCKIALDRLMMKSSVDVLFNTTVLDIKNDKTDYLFRATGQVIKFDGFLKVYFNSGKEVVLPELNKDDAVDLIKLDPLQHFTQPPARYSDATLVKALEEKIRNLCI